jgi:hypothetical protein
MDPWNVIKMYVCISLPVSDLENFKRSIFVARSLHFPNSLKVKKKVKSVSCIQYTGPVYRYNTPFVPKNEKYTKTISQRILLLCYKAVTL